MSSSPYILRQLFNMAVMHPQKISVVLDDQTWTYSELIEGIKHIACHLHRLNIVQEQIIYQFVERSFEMICGYYGIMYAGGVCFPLNPTDPHDYLDMFHEQSKTQYVLVHQKTRKHFPLNIVQHVIIMDAILHPLLDVEDINNLPLCSKYGLAYIIYSSGIAGQRKAIVHTHKSLSAIMNTNIHWDIDMYTSHDQVLQVATCSHGIHIFEILFTLSFGGTLVLLPPDGLLDMDYFSRTIIEQKVTTLTIDSRLMRALTNYVEIRKRFETFKSVRSLCMTGKAIRPQQWMHLIKLLKVSNTRLFTLYGMPECGTLLACQLSDIKDTIISLGYPLPSVQYLLIDEENLIINNKKKRSKIGEIHIGGPTLFTCYLNDPERTTNTFVTIDNQVYMKTGDLGRYNEYGEVVYIGRIDFQIKIHGQLVETIEIENTIMNWSPTNISDCLVTKVSQNDDLLVAYIISNDLQLDTKEIRDYCTKHLQPCMIPSYFIILKKFPLTANGEIDRKQLPLPSVNCAVSNNCIRNGTQSVSDLEVEIHDLWCSILQLDTIPHYTNYFELGGSSLSLIQIFNYYQFHLTPDKQLNIIDFFIHPTIADHIRLLLENETLHEIYNQSQSMNIREVPATFVQSRIWHNERIGLDSDKLQTALYNMPFVYRLSPNYTLSIKRLQQALQTIVLKHQSLRTSLVFDTKKNQLMQRIMDSNISCYNKHFVVVESIFETDQQLNDIINDENRNPQHFNFIQGVVFRCHIIYYKQISSKHLISHRDRIIFNFHYALFDYPSIDIFLSDLDQAYTTGFVK